MLISPVVAEEIRRVAAEMGYNPAHHEAARRLALSKAGTPVLNHVLGLMFITALEKSVFHGRIFEGLAEAAEEAGFSLLITNTEGKEHIPVPPSYSRGEVDGVILAGGSQCITDLLRALREDPGFGRRPAVSLHRMLPGCSHVLADTQAGAQAAAEHLFALGHRHIAYFACREAAVLAGLASACRTYGLDPARCLLEMPLSVHYLLNALTVEFLPAIHTPQKIPWQADEPVWVMLREHPEITAILAPNDAAAHLTHYLLTLAGVRVPEQMSLVGFDDTDPLYDAHGDNLLTSVRLPLMEMGRQSVRQLSARVTGAASADRTIVLPVELVVRATTAPPR